MNIKRKIISVFSSVLILNLLLAGCDNFKIKEVFNKDNIVQPKDIVTEESNYIESLDAKGIIEKLTCDEYLSRQVGTTENVKSAKFIKNYFETVGLAPFNNKSYYEDVNVSKDFLRSITGEDNVLGVQNVIGVIKGKDSSKAVVISAHFDHVTLRENDEEALSNNETSGTKITKIQGAVDNASGVSVLLESARDLAKYYKEDKPPYDIIFAAFNAEELGLVGSSVFVTNFKDNYDKWYNINIDCIGIKGNEGLAVKDENKNCKELYSDFIKELDEKDIYYEDIPYAMNKDGDIVGTSDHLIFRKNNSASLVIGQDGIVGTVHTEEDNISIIDFELIESIENALVDFIIKNGEKIY